MQKIIGSLFILSILVACGSNPETPENHDLVDTSGQVDEQYIADPDSELVQPDEAFAQLVEDFPKHWVKVDVKKDKKVYTVLCGMDTPSLQIEKIENHWEIRTIYGQDSESWHIINMTANHNTFNEQELQEGIFVVEKLTYPDDEFYEVSYFWNKTAEFCTFGDFFSPDAKFAEHSKMSTFEVVKEKCN